MQRVGWLLFRPIAKGLSSTWGSSCICRLLMRIFAAWQLHVQQSGHAWTSMCRILRRKAAWFQRIMARAKHGYQDFQCALMPPSAQPRVPADVQEDSDKPELPFVCEQCGNSFADAKGLSVGKLVQHEQYAYVRAHMPDPGMLRCMQSIISEHPKIEAAFAMEKQSLFGFP